MITEQRDDTVHLPTRYGRRETDWRREGPVRTWHPGDDDDDAPLTTRVARGIQRAGRSRKARMAMVGAGMLGVAGPLIGADSSPVSVTTPPTSSAGEAASTFAPAGNAEDVVERRIAEAAESERRAIIDDALGKFDIEPALAASIHDIAAEEGIHPRMAYGLVFTESTFRPTAVSHMGAVGLTQLLPSTARWIAPDIVQRNSQLNNPETNLRVGFRYLRYLLDKYNGDAESALTAYNRGPGTVDRILSRGGNPDNGYAGKVVNSAP